MTEFEGKFHCHQPFFTRFSERFFLLLFNSICRVRTYCFEHLSALDVCPLRSATKLNWLRCTLCCWSVPYVPFSVCDSTLLELGFNRSPLFCVIANIWLAFSVGCSESTRNDSSANLTRVLVFQPLYMASMNDIWTNGEHVIKIRLLIAEDWSQCLESWISFGMV